MAPVELDPSVFAFDLFVLGWVLLMLAIVAGGWVRGDVDTRRAQIFAGMFLAFLPMVAGNAVTSVGLAGQTRTAARFVLLLVGVGGLGLSYRGLRTDSVVDAER